MKFYTIEQLATHVKGQVRGDLSHKVTGFNGLNEASADDITYLAKNSLIPNFVKSRASCCITTALLYNDIASTTQQDHYKFIIVEQPELAALKIQNLFNKKSFIAQGVSPQAVISAECQLGKEISIAPFVYVADRVTIGERVTIHAGAVLEEDVVIADDVIIHPNVIIKHGSLIGKGSILHSGVVIGSDGFGFISDSSGKHHKQPQVGRVVIGDNVEIGANSCIDRATFGETRIANGVKIDNLVQVGHNVEIGENSIFVAQSGVAGSTKIGSLVLVGGQSAINGHCVIEDQVNIAAKSGVHNSQKSGSQIGGHPAIDIKEWRRSSVAFRRIPTALKDIKKLRQDLAMLTQQLAVILAKEENNNDKCQ